MLHPLHSICICTFPFSHPHANSRPRQLKIILATHFPAARNLLISLFSDTPHIITIPLKTRKATRSPLLQIRAPSTYRKPFPSLALPFPSAHVLVVWELAFSLLAIPDALLESRHVSNILRNQIPTLATHRIVRLIRRPCSCCSVSAGRGDDSRIDSLCSYVSDRTASLNYPSRTDICGPNTGRAGARLGQASLGRI